MALAGGAQIPVQGGGFVLGDAAAVFQELRIGILRLAAAGLGGAAIPVGGLGLAAAHARAGLIHHAQMLGGFRVAGPRGGQQMRVRPGRCRAQQRRDQQGGAQQQDAQPLPQQDLAQGRARDGKRMGIGIPDWEGHGGFLLLGAPAR